MFEVAKLTTKERDEIIKLTARKKGIREALVEKDFWVCFILAVIFEKSSFNDHILFKGGTSLSKAYNLIKRFSEDIDIILDWRELGISDELAWKKRSNTQQDKFNHEVDGLGAKYIKENMLPELSGLFSDLTNSQVKVVLDEDPHVVNVQYPRSFNNPYLLPQVKLEIGPRASRVPFEEPIVTSFLAEEYPQLFVKQSSTIKTITSIRTFWEKITILHYFANMSEEKIIPPRQSRHYYDVYVMSRAFSAEKILDSMEILHDVVEFKQQFYYIASANYQLAKKGTLKIVPSESKLKALSMDYEKMHEMIFGDFPDFSKMLADLKILEDRINLVPD